MKIVATLLAYLAASAALLGGLVSGVVWLISPGPTLKQDARVAPIPPRIAESIERKMVPAAAPEPVKAVVNEPVQPAMKEADVALTPPPRRFQVRELNSQTPVKRKPPRDERGIASQESSSPQEASSASVRAVSTGRTDFPY